jgi:hypothetical protein
MSNLPSNWSPSEPPRRRNPVFPALITLLCALLLLGGSALGFVATCSWGGQNPWNAFFVRLTGFLFVVFILAVLWFVISAIVRFFTAEKDHPK